MLSSVERGQRSPTLRVATQIAEGLACPLTVLLDASGPPSELVVRRAGGEEFVDAESGVRRRGLSPLLARRGVEASWYSLPPGSRAGPFEHRAPGLYEHLTVVRGRILARVGDREIQLGPGDSLTYRADVRHSFANPGRSAAEYLHISA